MRSVLLLALLAFFTSVADGGEPRAWTSANGKFKIEEAKMVGLETNDKGVVEVLIEKKNGKVARVPLSMLSKEDQAYVEGQSPGSVKAADPQPPAPKLNTTPIDGAESRSWKSAGGSFQIDHAKMISVMTDDAGVVMKVVIEKADSKQLTVPLAKLSQADRDYINRIHNSRRPDVTPLPEGPQPLPEGPQPPASETADPAKPPEAAPLPPPTPTIDALPKHAAVLLPPKSSNQWLNLTAPITPQTVGKKAVVLVCIDVNASQINIARLWVKRVKSLKSLQNTPVIFVAVLPKLTRPYAKKYLAVLAKANIKFDWPLLIDRDGAFSAAVGAPGSRKWGVRGINGQGKMIQHNLGTPASAANTLLKTASWRVDPRAMPESMRKTWLKIEQGDFLLAADPIQKGMKSKNAEHRRYAEKLNRFIQGEISELAMRAQKAMDAGNKVHAYRACDNLMREYRGYEIDKKIVDLYNKLSEDAQLEDDIDAFKAFDKAVNLPRVKNRVSALKALRNKYPHTTAAKDVEVIFKRMSMSAAEIGKALAAPTPKDLPAPENIPSGEKRKKGKR